METESKMDWIKKLEAKKTTVNIDGFRAAFYRWLEIYAPENKKTTQIYKNIIDMQLLPVLGDVALEDINLDHLIEIYERISNLAPKTL